VEVVPDRLQHVDLWLLDSFVVPASLHDVDGYIIHINSAAERASGRSNAQMRGLHHTVLLPEGAKEKVDAQFRRAVERGEPTDFETAFIDAGGHLRGVRAQQFPLRAGDAIIGVLILAYEAGRQPSEPIGAEPDPRLTPRQRQILDLIASGQSTSEIATTLKLSTETVRNHVRRILSELQVHTRVEAIAAARRFGLLAAPPLKPQPSD
jgi:PAS domain S-box-containing protein